MEGKRNGPDRSGGWISKDPTNVRMRAREKKRAREEKRAREAMEEIEKEGRESEATWSEKRRAEEELERRAEALLLETATNAVEAECRRAMAAVRVECGRQLALLNERLQAQRQRHMQRERLLLAHIRLLTAATHIPLITSPPPPLALNLPSLSSPASSSPSLNGSITSPLSREKRPIQQISHQSKEKRETEKREREAEPMRKRYAWQADRNRDGSSKRAAHPSEYAVSEVVRCKESRLQMTGHECENCRSWYEEMGDRTGDRDKLVQHLSRHRTDLPATPPSTPPGIWDLTFPSTQHPSDATAATNPL